jgi:hypothetical protein
MWQENFDFKQNAIPETIKEYTYEAYHVIMHNEEIHNAAASRHT